MNIGWPTYNPARGTDPDETVRNRIEAHERETNQRRREHREEIELRRLEMMSERRWTLVLSLLEHRKDIPAAEVTRVADLLLAGIYALVAEGEGK